MMRMLVVVADSSPVIYLTRLGLFNMLRALHDEVIVPLAVWNEIVVGGAGFPESEELQRAVADGWIAVRSPGESVAALGSGAATLGAGEIQAIQLARETFAMLVTDDSEARAFAEQLGVRVTGTVGLLIRARNEGHVPELRPVLDRLLTETNFRMSDQLYRAALNLSGERAP